MLIYSTVRHSYWEGRIGRQIMKERMIGLNWFKSYTMNYEAPSLAIGSVLGQDRDRDRRERGDWLAAEQQKKNEKIVMIIQLTSFIQINSQLQSRQ